MLKWAVNAARQSYLPPITDETGCEAAEPKRLKRKSSELFPQRPKICWQDKENLMTSTSTPLHPNSRVEQKSPLLKDISNILLENIHISPTLTPKTPEPQPQVPRQYASTLPSFDVEYSPNGLIPGPILALRGLGVPDNYFDKPRYLTQEQLEKCTPSQAIEANTPKPTRVLLKNNAKVRILEEDESTLSSSRMGDMTLERMIDAILESTRKERKYARPPIMSPTYTAAEDPASDLQEYWDAASAQYLPNAHNEREVRNSPSLVERLRQSRNLSYQLRRQRAVRRKRKLGKIGKSVRSKLTLSMALGSAEKPLPPTPLPVLPLTPDAGRNISPDSGHNSTSDLEEDTLQAVSDKDNVTESVDATKRRLRFSCNTTLVE